MYSKVAVNTPEEFEMIEAENDARKKREAWQALASFWILGLCNNYGYVVMLSAANDILHEQQVSDGVASTPEKNLDRDCNYVSTGAILLADILPSLCIKLIGPFLPFFIHVRIAACIITSVLGFFVVAFSQAEWMSILGVIFTSFSCGLGEASILQYSSFYHKNVISTWSSGTGAAGIVGALSYLGLYPLGLRTALLIMLVVPAVESLVFWGLLPAPDKASQAIKIQRKVNQAEIGEAKSTLKTKLKIIPGLLKYIGPLSLVYLFEYFINQGTFELINFDNVVVDHSLQYRWLQVDYQIGVFLSRSSVNLFHIKQLWIFSILQLINVAIFTSEAIFYFVPSFYIILALTLWEGLLGGAAYVNTFYKVSREVPEEEKQFSMACTSFSDSIGITLAGIIAIVVHNSICKLPKPTRLTF